MKKVTVFAMSKKGYSVIQSMHVRHPGIIDTVVAGRDSGVANDYFDEIKAFCNDSGISFKNRRNSYSISTEYSIAVSWRWLIETKSSRLIILHDSLLPRYRGFNPLVTALIDGAEEIGVTALYASREYDRGDIIAHSVSRIQYPITICKAIEIVLGNYSSLAVELADCLNRGDDPAATPQFEVGASYSLWRDEEDYFIDWTTPATTVRRVVDSLGFPYRGAAATLDGKVVRILRVEALDDVTIANRTPGKVIFVQDSKPVVVCGHGLLRIDEMTDDSGFSLLPLNRFRMRFKGFVEHGAPWNSGRPHR